MSDISSGPFQGHKRPPYKALKQSTGDLSPKRPKLAREHSDNLLSYYESSIPNEARDYTRTASPENVSVHTAHHHTRKLSTTSTSTSSSDYSNDSVTTDARDAGSETSSSVRKRSTAPSKGGADRRRVAIVEMDAVSGGEHGKSTSDIASHNDSIRQRRGHKTSLAGLALVAPPDAALRTYTQLTPPSTAPLTGDSISTAHPDNRGHHRSTSELTPSRKFASREMTSSNVGTRPHGSLATVPDRKTRDVNKNNNNNVPHYTSASRSTSPTHSAKGDRLNYGRGLLSPPDSAYPSMSQLDMFSPIVTPEIGEAKEIHMPVAAPVVVDLERLQSKKTQSTRTESPAPRGLSSVQGSSGSLAPSASSAYLHYQPGVHATAGPLPPPPRAMFNIDVSSPPPPRPPRMHSPTPPRTRGDIDAVKQALQLPPSVAAVLASKSPQLNPEKPIDIQKKEAEDDKSSMTESHNGGSHISNPQSIHRREGATLSSSIDSESITSGSSIPRTPSPESSLPRSSVEDPTPRKLEDLPQITTTDELSETPLVTIVEPPTPSRPKEAAEEKLDHSKFDSWLKENPHLTQPAGSSRDSSLDKPRRESSEQVERPLSPLSADHTGDAPSPPPKSFRHQISNNLKRLSSLPRAPSLSSRSNRRVSEGSRYSSRTPSPSVLHRVRSSRPSRKMIATNPAALYCHEVYSQNTTLQRCAIYAAKINELYLYDCGLSDWIAETQGQNSQPRAPSSTPFAPQPRQTSRSSIISEATFPRRPDASTATDLSHGAYRDITPPGGVPPALPYPSLAMNPPRSAPARSNTSVSSNTPPSSLRQLAPSLSTSSKGTGFFASLGRKASLSRKDRPVLSPGPTSAASPVGPPGRIGGGGGGVPKHNGVTKSISRPINMNSPPTVPGGPRAPPQRAQRSQTLMSSVTPPTSSNEGTIGRRPSLFNLSKDNVVDIKPDAEFSLQVDKLKALMPHADRDVLAGYLRRAGQDLLAIGQYLEDERMGTIRQP